MAYKDNGNLILNSTRPEEISGNEDQGGTCFGGYPSYYASDFSDVFVDER